MSIKKQSMLLGVFTLLSFMALQAYIGGTRGQIHVETKQLISYINEKEELSLNKEKLSDVLLTQRQKELDKKIEVVSNNMNTSIEDKTSIFIILVVNILINLGLYLFSNRIIYNLSKVQDGLNSFFSFMQREGNKVEKIVVKGHDEFYDISIGINENIKEIEESLKKDQAVVSDAVLISKQASRGDFSGRINALVSNPEINQLKESLNNLVNEIQKNLKDVVSTLVSYEKKEYKRQILFEGEGELKALVSGVNCLGKTLENTHNKIEISLKSKSNLLNTSADKLQYNVKSLSEFIAVEKNNSQQVSQRMQDMNDKIQGTVAKSNEMKIYAKDTTRMAQSGEKLAEKTFLAMQEIKISTESINEAITAIDSISFQTNILSLNAAVEAATAGEAGKGFAVVAQEVRNLAAKSSDAAKSIKELVETTQKKANEGMNISEDMRENFLQVNNKIEETYKLIGSVVTEASKEVEMIDGINILMDEIKMLSIKNSDVAQTTDMISDEIITIARDLQNEVENTKEKAEV
jgi:methyl-accepting chemotaxis protein